MNAFNSKNEYIKRRYRRHLEEARGLAIPTIDSALRAIVEFEQFTGNKEFGRFRDGDAIAFKKRLLHERRTDALSARSTVHTKLKQLRKFIRWLAEQEGYRTRVRMGDADFFNLSARDVRLASERHHKPSPTLQQVQHVIRTMPSDSWIEKRDRAIIALALLTGARVSALASLKLKHVRADRQGIDQDAREVRTKFAKTFTTFFVHVGDDIREMFLAYVDMLTTDLLWGNDDPLFPCTKQFPAASDLTGFERRHWKSTDPIRRIFKRAFLAAGIPYFSPHSLRRTLVLLGQERCTTAEEFKCWSDNIGHDEVLTTFTSYGGVDSAQVCKVIASLTGEPKKPLEVDALVEALSDHEVLAALRAKMKSTPGG